MRVGGNEVHAPNFFRFSDGADSKTLKIQPMSAQLAHDHGRARPPK